MDDKEFALAITAQKFVESIVPKADGFSEGMYPMWHGWAVREAWIAGYKMAELDRMENKEEHVDENYHSCQ